MSPWRKRFFETTRGHLVALLRRGRLTVDEMATELGLTDNAVRAQLTTLERDGLVVQSGVRRGAGKPSIEYGLASEFEPTLSRAYPPLLLNILRSLDERLSEPELAALLREAGDRWSAEVGAPGGTLRERAEQAVVLLGQLGADVELEAEGSGLVICGFGCPLGLAVREQPRVCLALEALLSKVMGAEVREHCDRAGSAPSCRFAVAGPS